MKAYHGDAELKRHILEATRAQRKSGILTRDDNIDYWDKDLRQGCPSGCLAFSLAGPGLDEGDTHFVVSQGLGLPVELCCVEDLIFFHLAEREGLEWPEQFLEAIRPGSNLGPVWPRFAAWMLLDANHGIAGTAAQGSPQWQAIEGIGTLFSDFVAGREIGADEWRRASQRAINQASRAAAAARELEGGPRRSMGRSEQATRLAEWTLSWEICRANAASAGPRENYDWVGHMGHEWLFRSWEILARLEYYRSPWTENWKLKADMLIKFLEDANP